MNITVMIARRARRLLRHAARGLQDLRGQWTARYGVLLASIHSGYVLVVFFCFNTTELAQ